MEEAVGVENFIGGDYVPYSGDYLESFDPSTARVWALIPDSGAPEVELAVEAATKAFTGYV